jgi:hypothetical protein
LVVHHLADADLGDLDTARQAGAGVAVEGGVPADTVAAGFEEGVLFGVEAETGRETDATSCSVVAARAWMLLIGDDLL